MAFHDTELANQWWHWNGFLPHWIGFQNIGVALITTTFEWLFTHWNVFSWHWISYKPMMTLKWLSATLDWLSKPWCGFNNHNIWMAFYTLKWLLCHYQWWHWNGFLWHWIGFPNMGVSYHNSWMAFCTIFRICLATAPIYFNFIEIYFKNILIQLWQYYNYY